MSSVQDLPKPRLLFMLGGLALVVELVVFENSLGLLQAPIFTSLFSDILKGILLLLSVVSISAGIYLRYKTA